MVPDVTIVVATHNRPRMLEVELHSILASAATVGPNITTRILVVDDASETMAAEAITKRLGVDYIRREENGGVAEALVTGFEQVDSPYYAFWGDDDFMWPRWFGLHLARMAEGYDVVAGSFWKADAGLLLLSQKILPPVTLEDLKHGLVSVNDGALVRRDSLGSITYRPERERAMMMTFWLAMAAAGKTFTSIDEPTWLYRRHGGNLSNQRTKHDNALRDEAIAEHQGRRMWDAFG